MTVKTVRQANAIAVAEPETERLDQLAKYAPIITTNPERMSGTPVVRIERLPVTTLLDYSMDGYTVARFCELFACDPALANGALQTIRKAFEEGQLRGLLAERVDY